MSYKGLSIVDNSDISNYRFLNIFVPKDGALFENDDSYNSFITAYKKHVESHNKKIRNTIYKDAGFDLLLPSTMSIAYNADEPTTMIDLGIQCSMYGIRNDKTIIPSSYFLYPRSSTGLKTPLRIANSVGIIDSGYRGNIKANVDYFYPQATVKEHETQATPVFELKKEQRLFQLCSGDLTPIIVKIVSDVASLDIVGTSVGSERGAGGFGSTGLGGQTTKRLRQRNLNSQGLLTN